VLGVDSNVLLRFLTGDNKAQSAVATALIDQAENGSLFLSTIVLVEVHWVLRRAFKRSTEEVLEALDELVDSHQFTIEERARVIRAIAIARATRADFADALIALGNESMGCERTATFDVDALDIAQMISVEEAIA
jgi:predicted nucleic-acid-binding protein